MPFAVELFFDATTERMIRAVWARFASAGLGNYMIANGVRPHVALVVYDIADRHGLSNLLPEIVGSTERFSLKLAGVSSFGYGIVYQGIEPSAELRRLHDRTFSSFSSVRTCVLHQYYLPEQWVPHCSIAQSIPGSMLPEALRLAKRLNWVCPWVVESIGIVRYPPTVHLLEIPLPGRGIH